MNNSFSSDVNFLEQTFSDPIVKIILSYYTAVDFKYFLDIYFRQSDQYGQNFLLLSFLTENLRNLQIVNRCLLKHSDNFDLQIVAPRNFCQSTLCSCMCEFVDKSTANIPNVKEISRESITFHEGTTFCFLSTDNQIIYVEHDKCDNKFWQVPLRVSVPDLFLPEGVRREDHTFSDYEINLTAEKIGKFQNNKNAASILILTNRGTLMFHVVDENYTMDCMDWLVRDADNRWVWTNTFKQISSINESRITDLRPDGTVILENETELITSGDLSGDGEFMAKACTTWLMYWGGLRTKN